MLRFSKTVQEKHVEMSEKKKRFLSYWGSCALPSAEKLAYSQIIVVKKKKKNINEVILYSKMVRGGHTQLN